MSEHKNQICADLYYGWHECESGIYHAFELKPDGTLPDSEMVSGRLAELLDTTTDDPRFDWNVMRVVVPLKDDPVKAAKQLPPEVLEAAFRLKLREEAARRKAEEESNCKEGLYFVRAIGKDVYKDFEPEPHSAALARVQGIFQDTMKNHPWIETDACGETDESDGEFTVTAEEFYQAAYILPVNAATGPEYLLEEIRRAVAAAECATTMYQHTLEDCGTYDYTYHIRELTNQLQTELQEREERRA